MNDQEFESLRKKLGGGPVASPPPDLLDRIKSEIPAAEVLAAGASAPAEREDHPAVWRLVASVLMIFGFAYVGARIYLDSRASDIASAAPTASTYDRSAPLSQIAQSDSSAGESAAEMTNETTAPEAAKMRRDESTTAASPAPPRPQAADREAVDLSGAEGAATEMKFESVQEVTVTQHPTAGATAAASAPAAAAPPPPPPVAVAEAAPQSSAAAAPAAADSAARMETRRAKEGERRSATIEVDATEWTDAPASTVAIVDVAADGRVTSVRFDREDIPAVIRRRTERLLRQTRYDAGEPRTLSVTISLTRR